MSLSGGSCEAGSSGRDYSRKPACSSKRLCAVVATSRYRGILTHHRHPILFFGVGELDDDRTDVWSAHESEQCRATLGSAAAHFKIGI